MNALVNIRAVLEVEEIFTVSHRYITDGCDHVMCMNRITKQNECMPQCGERMWIDRGCDGEVLETANNK